MQCVSIYFLVVALQVGNSFTFQRNCKQKNITNSYIWITTNTYIHTNTSTYANTYTLSTQLSTVSYIMDQAAALTGAQDWDPAATTVTGEEEPIDTSICALLKRLFTVKQQSKKNARLDPAAAAQSEPEATNERASKSISVPSDQHKQQHSEHPSKERHVHFSPNLVTCVHTLPLQHRASSPHTPSSAPLPLPDAGPMEPADNDDDDDDEALQSVESMQVPTHTRPPRASSGPTKPIRPDSAYAGYAAGPVPVGPPAVRTTRKPSPGPAGRDAGERIARALGRGVFPSATVETEAAWNRFFRDQDAKFKEMRSREMFGE